MKKLAFSLLLCIPFFVATAQETKPAGETRKLPVTDVKTPEMKTVSTSIFDNGGKPIVICFWATWCKPCIEELTAINENYDDWKKETGVKVIALSIDDSRTSSRVGPFVNGKSWDYEVYIDPNGDFKRAMNVGNPPQSFVLDGKKDIKWTHVSYAPGDEKKLYEVVKKVAEGKPINE